MNRPTVYITGWNARKHHGPGRKFSIMASTPDWAPLAGTVIALAPLGELKPLMFAAVAERKAGDETTAMEIYKAAFIQRLSLGRVYLPPTRLVAFAPQTGMGGGLPTHVCDGDSLLCTCAVGVECHRRWIAPFLARAGWAVVLDGQPFTEDSA